MIDELLVLHFFNQPMHVKTKYLFFPSNTHTHTHIHTHTHTHTQIYIDTHTHIDKAETDK